MLVIFYSTNCSSNRTGVHTDQFDTNKEITILLGGLVAFLGHGMALLILYRPKSASRLGSIRLNLTILSATELALSAFIIILAINNLIFPSASPVSVPILVYGAVVFWNINALICSRNWIVALIALSRCEAIFRPIESRSNKFFSRRRTFLYITGILLVSYGLQLTRLFSNYVNVCVDEAGIAMTFKALLGYYKGFKYFEIYFIFAYQSVLPVVIVSITTILMIYTLLCSKPIEINICHGSRQNFNRKATRTVLTLALVFTLMETPIFLINIFKMSLNISHYVLVDILYYICRILVVLDSCCNIFIYVLTSDRFRTELVQLFRDVRRGVRGVNMAESPSRYLPTSSNELVLLRNEALVKTNT